jgi:hypothetical protein
MIGGIDEIKLPKMGKFTTFLGISGLLPHNELPPTLSFIKKTSHIGDSSFIEQT